MTTDISMGEAFLHVSQLSTAHTALNEPDPADYEDGEEMPAPLPEGMSVDFGYYKEGDIAVWSITRIINGDKSALIAGRMNRMNVVNREITDGIPVDVLAIEPEGEDGGTFRVTHITDIPVKRTFGILLGGEYSIPHEAVGTIIVSGASDTDNVPDDGGPEIISSSTVFSSENVLGAIDNPATAAFLQGLIGLDIADRYVGKDISEREAVSGREKAKELYDYTDALFEDMLAGKVLGSIELDLNLDVYGDKSETRMLITPQGKCMTIIRIPADKPSILDSNSEVASKVKPPSVLADNSEQANQYNYSVNIVDPVLREGTAVTIDGKKLIVSQASHTSFDLHELIDINSDDKTIKNVFVLQQQQLANGTKYLDNEAIETTMELVKDTGTLGRYMELIRIHGYDARLKISRNDYYRLSDMLFDKFMETKLALMLNEYL